MATTRTHTEVRAELDRKRAEYRRWCGENRAVLAEESRLHDELRRLGAEEVEAIHNERRIRES